MLALCRRFTVFAAAITLLVILLLHLTPVVPWVVLLLARGWEEPKGEVLIVLAADRLADGTVGVSSYWRTVYAARAWKKGMRVVFSGTTESGTAAAPSTAAAMRQLAQAFGVPPEAAVIEELSRNTHENATRTAAIVSSWPGKKILITSDFHMLRARRCFARAGLTVVPAPVPDAGKRWNNWQSRWECICTVAEELVKLGYYRWKGWI